MTRRSTRRTHGNTSRTLVSACRCCVSLDDCLLNFVHGWTNLSASNSQSDEDAELTQYSEWFCSFPSSAPGMKFWQSKVQSTWKCPLSKIDFWQKWDRNSRPFNLVDSTRYSSSFCARHVCMSRGPKFNLLWMNKGSGLDKTEASSVIATFFIFHFVIHWRLEILASCTLACGGSDVSPRAKSNMFVTFFSLSVLWNPWKLRPYWFHKSFSFYCMHS